HPTKSCSNHREPIQNVTWFGARRIWASISRTSRDSGSEDVDSIQLPIGPNRRSNRTRYTAALRIKPTPSKTPYEYQKLSASTPLTSANGMRSENITSNGK